MTIKPATTSARKVRDLESLVGSTPLLKIHLELEDQPLTIFAKYEIMNLTGSIKDRMALHILRRAREEGAIQPGDEIVEASSGNTAISLAALGRALGHPVRIFMPDWMSQERVSILKAFGARVVPVSVTQGGFKGSIDLAARYAKQREHCFLPRQFSNPWNAEAHAATTGREILQQLRMERKKPTAFLAGVGTGGTIMGVGAILREEAPGVTIHPLEPAESPVLTAGHKVGHHRIQGISDEFIPPIVDLEWLDECLAAPDGDAILMAQRLCFELGLAVGISSGANIVGALMLARKLGEEAVVVTVLPDCNKKYLSTDLFRAEPEREDYLAPRTHFTAVESIPPASLC